MSKIQITDISVIDLEYLGPATPTLSNNAVYTAVIIEGVTEDESEVIMEFQNTNQPTMTYNSFVDFAKDWRVLGDHKFVSPELIFVM
jgi:hypothetical protein